MVIRRERLHLFQVKNISEGHTSPISRRNEVQKEADVDAPTMSSGCLINFSAEDEALTLEDFIEHLMKRKKARLGKAARYADHSRLSIGTIGKKE